MKKVLLIIVFLLLTSCSPEIKIYHLSTGTTGGAYYPIGSGIAELLSDHTDEYIVNAYASSASVDNAEAIYNNVMDMALIQGNVAYWSYKGLGMFEDNKNDYLRGMVSLYPEFIQVVTKKDSEINSIMDLRGKKISLGKGGSGNYFDAIKIMRAHGLADTDYEPYYKDFKDSATLLEVGSIDAIILTSGLPTNSILVLQGKTDIKLIPLEEKAINKLIEENTYYTEEIIPSGTYAGVDYDVDTLVTRALWVCHEDLDADLVYEMVDTFWSNVALLDDVHESAKRILIKDALKGMGIQLHPGARRYYEEKGFDLED